MTTRSFGQPLNQNINQANRRALAPLNIKNQVIKKQFVPNLEPTNPQYSKGDQENAFQKPNKQYLEKKSEKEEHASFTIFDENEQNDKNDNKDQDEILQENIEAVEKELTSFLIDSIEKSIASCSEFDLSIKSSHNDTSLMVVDDINSSTEIDKADESEASKENLSSCSLAVSEISYVEEHPEINLLVDYSSNIWLYLLEKERNFMPCPFYMSKQPNINSKMRSILIDWLVDVVDEYNLKDETFFLAANYIDRFLSKFSISRQEFQLLGTAALLIAAKYEEVYPPQIEEFVFITDDSFTKEQILAMEKTIIKGLNFDLSPPTCNYFLEFLASKLVLDKQTYCLAKYLALLSCLECTPFLKYYPSEIAICALIIATKIIPLQDQESLNELIESSLEYERTLESKSKGDVIQFMRDRSQLLEAMNQLRIYAHKHQQQAIQRKYSDNKYYSVTKIADSAEI